MRRLLPVVTAALVLLVGCSADDDPEPRIAPTDSSSAASTTAPPPSPTGPVEPTLPAEAAGEDAAAAEAFVRFYWEMVNYAQATGDVGAMRGLASKACSSCTAGADGISETYEAGGTIQGGEVLVSAASAKEISSTVGRSFSVNVLADITKQVVRKSDGRSDRFPGGPAEFQVIARFEGSLWSVVRLDVVQ